MMFWVLDWLQKLSYFRKNCWCKKEPHNILWGGGHKHYESKFYQFFSIFTSYAWSENWKSIASINQVVCAVWICEKKKIWQKKNVNQNVDKFTKYMHICRFWWPHIRNCINLSFTSVVHQQLKVVPGCCCKCLLILCIPLHGAGLAAGKLPA